MSVFEAVTFGVTLYQQKGTPPGCGQLVLRFPVAQTRWENVRIPAGGTG